MGKKTGKNRNGNTPSITDKLEKYAFRSTTQVLIHVLASIAIALVLYFLLHDKLSVPETYFVTITSSMSAASGALLAITIALANYYSLNAINWRDKLVDKLTEASARTRKQMEKSAAQHPEISRQLAPLYEKSLLYVPGKPINKAEIDEIAKSFLNWAGNQAQRRTRKIDAGDVTEYDSFEMHLRDALICEHEISGSVCLWLTTPLSRFIIPPNEHFTNSHQETGFAKLALVLVVCSCCRVLCSGCYWPPIHSVNHSFPWHSYSCWH